MIKPTFLAGAWLTLSVALISCGSSKTPAVSAGPQPLQTSKSIDLRLEHTDRWFIEFDTPTFNGLLSSQAVQMAQQNFRTLAHQEGIDYQENYAYTRLFSGMSIRTNATAIGAISRMPGVKAVYPVRSYSLPKTKSVTFDPQMATAVSQTGVDIAQEEMGLTGKGIRVGIIDSGLDLQHPAFAADRIVAKYDFVGDDYNSDTNPIPKPDEDPDDDCGGHGTHVAGIVGANGTIKGAAPGVSLGVYRVFGCEGAVGVDVIVAALERAVADRMDIVNMSLGSFGEWTGDPLDQAVEKAAKQGLIVVFSAGNNGAEGPFATSGHANAPASISVANFENIAVTSPYFEVGTSKIPFDIASYSGALPTSGTLELAKTGTPASTSDACTALPANSLTGKAVLIRRGTCTFYEKAINAQNAGAAAVLIYNRTEGLLSVTFEPPQGKPPVTIPGITLYKADGEALNDKIAAGAVTLKWLTPDRVMSVENPRGNLAADSSSYGPTQLLDLKPDLGAPGNYIYSTYPLELETKTGYATLSGTSMAAPHVAGAIALLLEKRPEELKGKPEVVRTLLQNHAIAQNFSFAPELPLLEAVHRQGAGMLDIVGSIEGTTSIEPGRLALGDGFGPFTKTLTLTNTTDQEIVYTPKHNAAMGTFGSLGFNPATGFREGASDVKFVQATVKVPAKGTATVDIVIKPPAFDAEEGTVYGGYLTFESGTAPTLSVPYLGLKGNYQDLPALVDATLLWFNPEDKKMYPQGPNAQFDLGLGQFPIFQAQFAMPVEKGSIDILNGDTMMPVYPKGSAWIELFHTGRNKSGSGYQWAWDGSLKAAQAAAGVPVTKTLPNGRYAMRIKVMRAGGAENNPADWDTFISPAFYITKTVPAPTP